jgi:hypothetical protein
MGSLPAILQAFGGLLFVLGRDSQYLASFLERTIFPAQLLIILKLPK